MKYLLSMLVSLLLIATVNLGFSNDLDVIIYDDTGPLIVADSNNDGVVAPDDLYKDVGALMHQNLSYVKKPFPGTKNDKLNSFYSFDAYWYFSLDVL